MTRAIFKLISLLTLFGANAFSWNTTQVLLDTDTVFVPHGYDSNDRIVQIFLRGRMPSTCYQWPVAEATMLEKGKILIKVTASKITDSNVLCIMAEIPYMIPVSLGHLNEGKYDLSINAGTEWQDDSTITIESPSAESIDNFTYANVTEVIKDVNSNTVIIEGYHPSSCMDFESIEIRPNENFNTFSILPIIKQTKAECDATIQPFSAKIVLPIEGKKEVLVHVRKIDGHAINYLFKN